MVKQTHLTVILSFSYIDYALLAQAVGRQLASSWVDAGPVGSEIERLTVPS